MPLNTATPRLANGLRTWWRLWWQRQRQKQYFYIVQDTWISWHCFVFFIDFNNSVLYYFVSSLSTNSVADFCWLSTSQLYCLTIENILLEYWALSTCIFSKLINISNLKNVNSICWQALYFQISNCMCPNCWIYLF